MGGDLLVWFTVINVGVSGLESTWKLSKWTAKGINHGYHKVADHKPRSLPLELQPDIILDFEPMKEKCK